MIAIKNLLLVTILFIANAPHLRADDANNANATALRAAEERQIAERFSPVIYQGIGKNPEADEPTRADFAGDYYALRNWGRTMNHSLPGYVYYSCAATETNWYCFYGLFYPRDYKGGPLSNKIIFLLHQIVNITHLRAAAEITALSHENDFEGVRVVIAKFPEPHVIVAESLAHSRVRKFATKEFIAAHPYLKGATELFFENGQPKFYSQPKGHGFVSTTGKQRGKYRIYEYSGRAEDPEKTDSQKVGYALLDIKEIFWNMPEADVKNFFAKRHNFQHIAIPVRNGDWIEIAHIEDKQVGTIIRGHVGIHNEAKLPWAWQAFTFKKCYMNCSSREISGGKWFFDPASATKKHFHLDDEECSRVYLYHPYLATEKR